MSRVQIPERQRRGLRSVRLLVECFQAFDQASSRVARSFGLTHAQFDILATLGNTEGMTFKELGSKTLITKGTLTGVVDRLVERGYVQRCAHEQDGRSTIVRLTPLGDALFERSFPVMVRVFEQQRECWSDDQHLQLEDHLTAYRDRLRYAARQAASLAADGEADDSSDKVPDDALDASAGRVSSGD